MSILSKAIKALGISESLKETLIRVIGIKPDVVIVCGMNTEKNHVVTAGAGPVGTQDAMVMLSSGLASVYMELPAEYQGSLPINEYLTSVNTMILHAIRAKNPAVLETSTVPVETVEPQLPPDIIPDEEVKEGSAELPIHTAENLDAQPVAEEYPEPTPTNKPVRRKGVMKAPTKAATAPTAPAVKRTRARKGAVK